MARIATLALPCLLLLAPAAHAVLTLQEQEDLALALDAVARGEGGEAVSRADEIFRSPDASVADLEGSLVGWYAARLSTEELSQWLRYATLDAPASDARVRAQQAVAGALVRSVAASFDALLPDGFGAAVADPVRLEDLRTRLQLLGELASRADGLSGAQRRAHVARLERLVAEHASLLRADVTLDLGAWPRLPILRAQLFKILRDLPRPFDADAFVAGAGFAGIHASIVRRYGIVVLDNNGFDLAQLDAIEQVLTAIPPELYRLTHISQYDFLENGVDGIDLRGSLGVNLAATPVYAAFENPFPPDVEPRRMRTFCGVLQHELNHAVDASTMAPNPQLNRRAYALLARAGRTDPLQYLRSMFPPETFPDAPQEFFASISNEYLTDSEHTLALAQARLEEGRTAPLDQFLFFADVYSRGGDSTLFFVQDEDCNYSAYPVSLRRDPKGRIERIVWPGGDVRFQLDRDGFVVR